MSRLLEIYMAESSVFCRGREAYLTVMNHAFSPRTARHTKYEREIVIRNRGKKIQSNKEIPNFTTMDWIEQYYEEVWWPLFSDPSKRDEELQKKFLSYRVDKDKMGGYRIQLTKDIRLYMKVLLAHHKNLIEYESTWWEKYRDTSRDNLVAFIEEVDDGSPTSTNNSSKQQSGHRQHEKNTRCSKKKAAKQQRRRLTIKELSEACPTETVKLRMKEKFDTRRGRSSNIKVTGEPINVTSGEGNCHVHVIGIDGKDVFDEATIEKVRKWISESLFASDNDLFKDGGGTKTKGRYFRIEAKKRCLFTLGKGRTIIESSSELSETGIILMEIAREILSVENDLVKEYIQSNNLSDTVELKPFDPNLMQIVVSYKGNYKKHSDEGPEVSIPFRGGVTHNALAEAVPYKHEQRVLTMVFTFPMDDDDDVGNDGNRGSTDGHCNLCHYRNGSKGGAAVNTFVTKETSIHYQGFGVQSYLQHDVKLLDSSSDSNCKRVIISFRTTALEEHLQPHVHDAIKESKGRRAHGDFDYDKEVLKADNIYKFMNVLKARPVQQRRLDDDSSSITSTGRSNKRKKKKARNKDKDIEFKLGHFKQNYKVHRSTDKIERPASTISVNKPPYQCLRGPTAVRILLEKSMFLCRHKEEENDVSWLDRQHELGSTAKACDIRDQYSISFNDRYACVYNEHKLVPDCVVPEQPYKNKFRPCAAAGRGRRQTDYAFPQIIDNVIKGGKDWLYSQDPGDIELWIGPKGGSGIEAGRHSQPATTNPHKADTYHTAQFQNETTSQELDFNVRTEAVIHLFAPKKWNDASEEDLMKDTCSDRDGEVVYLGLWYFCRMVMDRHEDLVIEGNPNTTWAREMSTLYYIRPLYNSKTCRPPDHLHDPTHRLQPFVVTEPDDSICKWIPNGTHKSDIVNITATDVITEWLNQEVAKEDRDWDDSVENDPLPDGNKKKLSLEQYVLQTARISISSFARTADKHVVTDDDGNKQLQYLCGPEWKNLGWVLGTSSIPHPIRTYNLQPFTFIQAMLPYNEDKECYERMPLPVQNPKKKLADLLFKASVLRLAGVVGVYVHFAEYMKKHHPDNLPRRNHHHHTSQKIYIPGIDDLVFFRQFLESTFGLDNKMCHLNHTLYRQSLFGDCTHTIKQFLTFLESYAEILPEQVQSKKHRTREEWVDLIHWNFFESYATNNKFLASLVIADVEEIVDGEPFGKPNDVYFGSGGRRGLTLLDDNKQHACRGNINKAKALVKYLENDAPDFILTSMGLFREKRGRGRGRGHGRTTTGVYIKLNRRRIQITDVDNIACKISIYQGKTTGARLISNKPFLNNVYDFPVLPQWLHGYEMELIQPICNEAIQMLNKKEQRQTQSFFSSEIHPQFRFHDEKNKWPKYCKIMVLERRRTSYTSKKGGNKKPPAADNKNKETSTNPVPRKNKRNRQQQEQEQEEQQFDNMGRRRKRPRRCKKS